MALESTESKSGPQVVTGAPETGLASASFGDIQRLNQNAVLPAAFADSMKLFGGSSPHAALKQFAANEILDTQIQFTTIGGFIADQLDLGVSLEEIQRRLESEVRLPKPDKQSNVQERGF